MERLQEGKVSEPSNEPNETRGNDMHQWLRLWGLPLARHQKNKNHRSAKRRYSTDRGDPHCHHICLWGCEAGKQINTPSLVSMMVSLKILR